MQELARKAILAALQCEWDKALLINEKILTLSPNDVDTLNRTAKALYELGEYEKASKITQKVLEIDPLNPIAARCIIKYQSPPNKSAVAKAIKQNSYLEIPGKSKIVKLINIAEEEIILSVDPGEPVQLSISNHRVSVNTHDGRYLGRFPDDIAREIINQNQSGSKHETFIKSTSIEKITIYISLY